MYRVRKPDPLPATDHALILIVAERALVADADKRSRSHITIADRTFTITFVAEASDGYARLLPAHHKIAVEVSVRSHWNGFQRAYG